MTENHDDLIQKVRRKTPATRMINEVRSHTTNAHVANNLVNLVHQMGAQGVDFCTTPKRTSLFQCRAELAQLLSSADLVRREVAQSRIVSKARNAKQAHIKGMTIEQYTQHVKTLGEVLRETSELSDRQVRTRDRLFDMVHALGNA